jgi:hypothetical protein
MKKLSIQVAVFALAALITTQLLQGPKPNPVSGSTPPNLASPIDKTEVPASQPQRSARRLVVVSLPGCGPCKSLYGFLGSRGVEYDLKKYAKLPQGHYQGFRVTQAPTLIAVDSSGNIVAVLSGFNPEDPRVTEQWLREQKLL